MIVGGKRGGGQGSISTADSTKGDGRQGSSSGGNTAEYNPSVVRGAVVGAAVGSVVPVVGTVIGAGVGWWYSLNDRWWKKTKWTFKTCFAVQQVANFYLWNKAMFLADYTMGWVETLIR